jgi:hypothetical protein
MKERTEIGVQIMDMLVIPLKNVAMREARAVRLVTTSQGIVGTRGTYFS